MLKFQPISEKSAKTQRGYFLTYMVVVHLFKTFSCVLLIDGVAKGQMQNAIFLKSDRQRLHWSQPTRLTPLLDYSEMSLGRRDIPAIHFDWLMFGIFLVQKIQLKCRHL